MINTEVREFKVNINKKEYIFRLDFEALRKFDNRYGRDGIELFNKFLKGWDTYDCIIKILSCSCVGKEWEEEELAKSIPFNFISMKLFDEITFALAEGIFTNSEEQETEDEKNEVTSQSNNI